MDRVTTQARQYVMDALGATDFVWTEGSKEPIARMLDTRASVDALVTMPDWSVCGLAWREQRDSYLCHTVTIRHVTAQGNESEWTKITSARKWTPNRWPVTPTWHVQVYAANSTLVALYLVRTCDVVGGGDPDLVGRTWMRLDNGQDGAYFYAIDVDVLYEEGRLWWPGMFAVERPGFVLRGVASGDNRESGKYNGAWYHHPSTTPPAALRWYARVVNED